MGEITFIYYKDGKIKCLTHKEALLQEKQLMIDGWKHTHTINANVFV